MEVANVIVPFPVNDNGIYPSRYELEVDRRGHLIAHDRAGNVVADFGHNSRCNVLLDHFMCEIEGYGPEEAAAYLEGMINGFHHGYTEGYTE